MHCIKHITKDIDANRSRVCVVILMYAIASCAFAATPIDSSEPSPNSKNTYKVDGLFSVGIPSEGYEWKKVREINLEAKDDKAIFFSCQKKDAKTNVVLTIQTREPKEDGVRRMLLKAFFNGTVESLKANGFKIVESVKPKLESPIPDQVSFSLKAERDGITLNSYVVTIFGKYVYMFQGVSSLSVNDAQKILDKPLETFKELVPNQDQ